MLERYKLRLGDGTVLVVDHDALSSWLMDGKATVQPVGTERWLPLRQFLAKEKAEAAAAARRNPRPEVVPPHPPLEPSPQPIKAPPLPPVPPLPVPPSVLAPVAAPVLSAVAAPVPPAFLAPVEPLILPPMSEPPVSPTDTSAAVREPPASVAEPPVFATEPLEVWAPAEEAAALAQANAEPKTPDDDIVIAALPSTDEPEAPLLTDLPSLTDSSEPAPSVSASAASASEPPVAASEPPEVWAPTEEAVALYEATVHPPKPEDAVSIAAMTSAGEPEDSEPSAELPSQPADSVGEPEDWAPTEEAAALYQATAELYENTALPSDDGDALWRTASQAMGERSELAPSRHPRSLQVLAESTVTPRGGSKAPSTSRDDLIPLKPLDDEDEAFRRGGVPPMVQDADPEPERATRLESSFLGLAPPWDARVSRWLELLSNGVARLGRGLDRVTPRDPASSARAFLDRCTHRDEPAPAQPTAEAASASVPGPTLHRPLKPPPPISELPVLRLAKIDESEDERVGDDIYQGGGSADLVWRWLKRGTLIAGLLVGAVAAANTWEVWLPAATQLGRAFFVGIHEREHPPVPSRVQQPPQVPDPLPSIAEQLPHLAPETVALVVSSSPTSALDPPEVFARAYDATERGLSALSAPEAQELGALQRALLNAILPAERQRVRDYELVRARRAPLPTENRDVLRSFAHGARALPQWARERLQQLSGKAIAAGLASPPEASPRAATAP